MFALQVFKVIKVLLAKIEKASEDPESGVNQSGKWCALLVCKRKGLHVRVYQSPLLPFFGCHATKKRLRGRLRACSRELLLARANTQDRAQHCWVQPFTIEMLPSAPRCFTVPGVSMIILRKSTSSE